jgi:Ca2+-binding EF-hand superfamily protein
MGLNLKYQMKSNVPINFSKDEISTYIKRFRSIDKSNKGYISMKDLRAYLKVNGLFASVAIETRFKMLDSLPLKIHRSHYLFFFFSNNAFIDLW